MIEDFDDDVLTDRSALCDTCKGVGWTHVRHAANGLYGIFEDSCEACNGNGFVDPVQD